MILNILLQELLIGKPILWIFHSFGFPKPFNIKSPEQPSPLDAAQGRRSIIKRVVLGTKTPVAISEIGFPTLFLPLDSILLRSPAPPAAPLCPPIHPSNTTFCFSCCTLSTWLYMERAVWFSFFADSLHYQWKSKSSCALHNISCHDSRVPYIAGCGIIPLPSIFRNNKTKTSSWGGPLSVAVFLS